MTLAELAKNPPAPSAEPSLEHGHFLFDDVSWEYYQQTLKQLERSGRHVRVTYDEGRMEIMTVSGWHEGIKKTVARLLEHYSFVKDIPIQGFGNITFNRKDLRKGLEPDECYYIVSKIVLTKRGRLDLVHGPPPDLAIEVEVSDSSIKKRPIYLAMGVPEIWVFGAEKPQVMKLQNKRYEPVSASRYFPDLDLNEFFRFFQMARLDQHKGLKAFDAWLRGAGAKK